MARTAAARGRTDRLVAAGLGVAALPGVVGALATVASTPALVLAGAVVPALAWAVVLVGVERARGADLPARGAAFAWGALVATWIASLGNDGLVYVAGTTRGLVPVVGAPLVEELAKALALIAVPALVPGAVRDLRSGAAIGALAGAGFAMVENVSYLLIALVQGGEPGLERAVWVRPVVGGLVHPAFTALTGAGVGWLRARGPWRAMPAGFAAAVVLHGAWNALGSRIVSEALCSAPDPAGPCAAVPPPDVLRLVVPLVTAASLAPAAAALVAAGRLARTRRAPRRPGRAARGRRDGASRGTARRR